MITEKFDGTVETAYGKKLATPVSFAGSFEAYENYDEVVKANDTLKNDEVVKFRNAQRKANARSKATTEALEAAGIQKPDPNSPEVLRETMIESLMKRKNLDEATATQIIDGLLSA